MNENYDYSELHYRKNYYSNAIYQKIAALEQAKLTNKRRAFLQNRLEELEALQKDYQSYLDDLKVLSATVESEDYSYKNRRLNFLDNLVTENLANIFPADGLQSHLVCDFYRKSQVTLELLDKHGNVLDPDICSGKLQQYLISFAAVTGIIKGMGIESLYIDEAFGAGAPEILGDIGKLILKHVEGGMQILLVAQNPGLYQDLPRHEIVLRKDPETESVCVESEKDY